MRLEARFEMSKGSNVYTKRNIFHESRNFINSFDHRPTCQSVFGPFFISDTATETTSGSGRNAAVCAESRHASVSLNINQFSLQASHGAT